MKPIGAEAVVHCLSCRCQQREEYSSFATAGLCGNEGRVYLRTGRGFLVGALSLGTGTGLIDDELITCYGAEAVHR
jgi:hypothetical protein